MFDFEDDYWDSPGFNDFWKGAPGLPRPAKERFVYGPGQVKSPEEVEIGKTYFLNLFNGIKEQWIGVTVVGKDETCFYYEGEEGLRGQMKFADCAILPREDGLWDDTNHLFRIEE